MKIRTLIIDDDLTWRKIIGKFAQMNARLEVVGSCASAMEGYAKMAETDVDLLICDIEMPEISGIAFIQNLRTPPLVIFVTSHHQYALDCYDVSPVDFLLKPLELDRFLKSIEKVVHRLQTPFEAMHLKPYFFVRESLSYSQIAYEDVLYMKANENFLQIVTPTQTYLPTLSISKMEAQLQGEIFIRVHRSYLVNRLAISQINRNDILLTSGETIPIGEQYRTQLNRRHIDGKVISR